MKNLIAKYRAPLALLLATVLGIFGVHQYNAAKVNGGVAAALAEAKAHPLAPLTVKQAPPVHLFGVVKGKPIAWVFDPKLNAVTFVHLTFGATSDNPAGWIIDPTTGALIAPSGKVIKGVSFVDSPVAVGTANLASMSGTQTVDGISVTGASTKKVWLFGQTTSTQDGCWVSNTSAWTRCPELATGDDAAGMYFAVGAGTANKGAWIVTNAAGGGIAGTNDLVGLNLSTLSGGGLTSPLSANLDFGTNRGIHIGSPQAIDDAIDGFTLNSHLIRVAAASDRPLPSYTYANNAGGVGATITGNTNAACPAFDGVTLQVGVAGFKSVLFLHGVSQADNGIYDETQNGDGSTIPCVLTRSTVADTSAKIIGSKVRVRFGLQHGGSEYEFRGSSALTIGTSALYWPPNFTNDANTIVDLREDFLAVAGFPAAAASGVLPGQLPFFISSVGAGSVCAAGATTRTEVGTLSCGTGTTTTGLEVLTLGVTNPPITYANTDELLVSARVQVPVVSDGTNTYRFQVGLGNTTDVTSTEGIFLDYDQATATTFRCTVRHASAGTPAVGPTVTAAQWYRWDAYKAPGDSTIHQYVDGTECGTGFTTNQPVASGLTPVIAIRKSAGTTARTFLIDNYRLRMVPAGSFAN